MIRLRAAPNFEIRARRTVREDGMKALALVDTPAHVCCRYRIGAFAEALEHSGWQIHLQALARGPGRRLAQLAGAGRFDAVILQRKLLPRWQVRVLRRSARRLVFDFDDAVLYRDSYDPRGPHCPRRRARFATVVRLADVILAGNDFLADCALRAGARHDRVRVIPTCIDRGRYRGISPRAVGSGSGPGLELVWIGSSSTLQGLEAQQSLWDRIALAVPGVRLRVICDRFPRFARMPVVADPWHEATEAESLAAGDVGISWIPDDLWSRGKCGLKVLQYQASGLPVLANPVGVHPQMIAHGRTGWLADGPDAWVAAVRTLADDPPLRRRMGEAARESVAANYAVEAWSERFVAAVTGGVAAGDNPIGRSDSAPTPPPRPRSPGRASSDRTTHS
jgi:hypothetical protein